MNRLIHFCLHQKLIVLIALALLVGWGVKVAPFDWDTGVLQRDPVPVDAIPDLGDNQQIVFTEYAGRSPQDVEDQITYPLTVSLLGIPGVHEVRSFSMFGYSYVYLIFEEDIEFYWSRSRVLEKLNSLPPNFLPQGVTPSLGPDATGLGQVFWYVLEGRDPDGRPIGGWDVDELRSIQDWQVRYALLSAGGIAEVASVGGYVRQYQIEVDPNALRAHDVHLSMVADAVRKTNQEIGARNLAINGVEYILRVTGYIEKLEDLRDAVVTVRDNVPITVGDVATVQLGPAMRRGALDINGADAVGGVVVSRFGANPLESIRNVKQKIADLDESLPTRPVINWDITDQNTVEAFARANDIAQAFDRGLINHDAWLTWTRNHPRAEWPPWLNTSKITIQPFYDRSGLIDETLNTLNAALFQQVLITIVVVVLMVLHLRSSLLISAMLPLAVLITFIAMKQFGIEANIVALSGIAIAIGTVVDVGIVLTENILKHLNEAPPAKSRATVIYDAVTEVASAVTTSVATTVVSFLPVFTMSGEAGRLFRPLAFTKTFALIASIIVALSIIPPVAHLLFRHRWKHAPKRHASRLINTAFALAVVWVLAREWMPLGFDHAILANALFVVLIIAGLLTFFHFFQRLYEPALTWALSHKGLFLLFPAASLCAAVLIWQGASRLLSIFPQSVRQTSLAADLEQTFPGLGREFRPALDEGSFLFMPTISPHASIEEAIDTLRTLDAAIASVPEVSQVVGKIGRVESPLDPAPISMIETVINYLPEYRSDPKGRPLLFQTDKAGEFVYQNGDLVPGKRGKPFRQWRPHIKTADDIWKEIERVARVPGATGAPKLQPIETRLVMLRTGMRAPMGIKIKGPSLEVIENFGIELERLLRNSEIPGLAAATISADRIVGKPYLEIVPDRQAAKRYGLNVADIHQTIQLAVGGVIVSTTVEGRERYGVQVRYAREMRDSIDALEKTLVASKEGAMVPLAQLAEIRYVRGPQAIKAEDTFLTGYVTFGSEPGFAEIDVVEAAKAYLEDKEARGELVRPAGVRYRFAGNYEASLAFNRTLSVMVPLCLVIIFLLLYLQNHSATLTLIVFSGVMVAWSGGFLMLWLYGQPGFLDFSLLGIDLRELFQIRPINLSTAVWVGFLALFGIATDDGVVISTYLRQRFRERRPTTIAEIRQATVEAGKRRLRPCLMTTGTTILALLPVLTSTGRGSDIMVPMAIPVFGGMVIELMTMFVVPVLFCLSKERALTKSSQ